MSHRKTRRRAGFRERHPRLNNRRAHCMVISLVADGGDESPAQSHLRRIVNAVYDRANPRADQTWILDRRVYRVAPLASQGIILFGELLKLVHLQSELVNNGIRLSGCITWGEVISDAQMVMGEATARATSLRGLIAGLPRIIVDPTLLRAVEHDPRLKAEHHDSTEELSYLRNLLACDSDGVWYVDYLRAMRKEMDWPAAYPELLLTHREMIQGGLRAHRANPEAIRPWLWLWRYHNRCVAETLGEEEAQLRVPTPRMGFDFPALSGARFHPDTRPILD